MAARKWIVAARSEEHTSELQSRSDLVCRLLLEKKNNKHRSPTKRRASGSWKQHRARFRRAGFGVLAAPAWVSEKAGGSLRVLSFFFFKDSGPPRIFPFSLPGGLPI